MMIETARRLHDEVARLALELKAFQEQAADDAALYDAKIKPLIECDRNKGTAYVETLRGYLDAFGHLGAAGERLHIHANTVRYRLRRIAQMTNIDLDDPDERLRLMLLLRMVANADTV